MKLPAAVAIVAAALAIGPTVAFSPVRISYASLLHPTPDASAVLLTALQDVGMVSVTDIPSFRKMETLTSLPSCIKESKATATHTYPDGTRRRTLATHSVPGDLHMLQHELHTDACQAFDDNSLVFRQTVADVTQIFASHLASLLDLTEQPILFSEDQDYTLQKVVEHGEHLEHFHSYQAPASRQDADVATIEWHTDQGLALIFTPGIVDGQPASGFYVQLADGSAAMVDFEPQDDLVILLGDGVHQYVNAALQSSSASLRALPHSLKMPETPDQPRVWYGRMVLPPADAYHPIHLQTFADLRNSMVSGESSQDVLAMGCSHTLEARQLEEISCDADELLCWHKCFNNTEELTENCTDKGLDLACINDKRELWIGDHNPAFYPGCVDLATAVNYTNTTDNDHGNHTHDGDGNHADGDGSTSTSASFTAGIFSVVSALAIVVSLVV